MRTSNHESCFCPFSLLLRTKFYLLPAKQTGLISCPLSCQRRNKCCRFHLKIPSKALPDTQINAFIQSDKFLLRMITHQLDRPFKIGMLTINLVKEGKNQMSWKSTQIWERFKNRSSMGGTANCFDPWTVVAFGQNNFALSATFQIIAKSNCPPAGTLTHTIYSLLTNLFLFCFEQCSVQ